MTDIVERLRSPRTEQGDMWPCPNLHEEAADEIERLRIEIERLQEYVDYRDEGWRHGIDDCIAADIY